MPKHYCWQYVWICRFYFLSNILHLILKQTWATARWCFPQLRFLISFLCIDQDLSQHLWWSKIQLKLAPNKLIQEGNHRNVHVKRKHRTIYVIHVKTQLLMQSSVNFTEDNRKSEFWYETVISRMYSTTIL